MTLSLPLRHIHTVLSKLVKERVISFIVTCPLALQEFEFNYGVDTADVFHRVWVVIWL